MDLNVQTLQLDELVESSVNPRSKESPEELADLVDSIRQKGIIQPITVRPLNGKAAKGKSYEIIAGHRRAWACELLKYPAIPALVKLIQDSEVFEYQMIENIQRTNLHPLKQAELFASLIKGGRSIEDIAEKIGKKPSYVAQLLQLNRLMPEAREYFTGGTITIDHALQLAKLQEDKQQEALKFLIEESYVPSKGKRLKVAKDVRVLADWVQTNVDMVLSSAPFDKGDETLIAGVPACLNCPKNSGYNTALFPELKGNHVCTDRVCFRAKMEAYQKRMHQQTRKEEKKAFILISTQHYISRDNPLKIRDVKLSGRYLVVKAGDECENTKKAQWIDGKSKGKFTLVCNYSKCKKHWKGSTRTSSNDYNSPANVAKRKAAEEREKQTIALEREYRACLFREIMSTKNMKLRPLDILRTIVIYNIKDQWRMKPGHPILDAFKAKSKKELLVVAEKAKEVDLIRLWVGNEISADTDVTSTWDVNRKPSKLLHYANLFRIDKKKAMKTAIDELDKIRNFLPDPSKAAATDDVEHVEESEEYDEE